MMNLHSDLDVISTGHFKIWKVNKETQRSTLLVDKPNTILYTGADLVAKALGGIPNTKISHMYLGYSNNVAIPAIDYAITKANSTFTPTTDVGYLRVPLTFPASFDTSDDTKYDSNVAVFTVLVTNADNYKVTGSPTISGSSKIFEAALSASLSGLPAGDLPLARITFTPTEYDSTFNLTISWGIKINLLTA